ncbi:hypothetical protein [Fusibacter ferrireducens]|uniref:Uncharacterized protein n=1 Tax=Fusibacter ferrireducens TaxID=2785058 RepID=A0ABR9ZP17_9FIRM|nr:hypothetical protein [Fusibacter ferrireducens]MBF4692215.1 hypothetical protein [Fusibacter ferrireducens]
MDTKHELYENKVYFLGRLTATVFLLLTFAIPVTLWLKWGILPTKEGFIAGLIVIMSLIPLISAGEFLSFAPIIGSAGYFVMLLSGNWMNIKVPASMVGLQSADIDPNSEEGEVLSTMAVAASAIVTEIIILVGVLLLTPFTSFFAQPSIKIGFAQIVPALFGALLFASVITNYRTVIVPAIVGIVIVKLNIASGLYNIPIMIAISVFVSYFLFKVGFFGKKEEEVNQLTTEIET